MPNVVGLNYEDATTSLTTAGVLVPGSIGYFGTWPISITWSVTKTQPIFFVTAQNPSSGTTNVAANAAVILTVSEPPMGVVYP